MVETEDIVEDDNLDERIYKKRWITQMPHPNSIAILHCSACPPAMRRSLLSIPLPYSTQLWRPL